MGLLFWEIYFPLHGYEASYEVVVSITDDVRNANIFPNE